MLNNDLIPLSGCTRQSYLHERRTLKNATKGIVVYFATIIALAGCSGDTLAPMTEHETYMRLVIDKPAVIMSTFEPYNTIQLSATAFRGDGKAISEARPVFRTSDENISVSETGLVTALAPTTQSSVIASAQYNGVTHTDTLYVTVTSNATPIPIETLVVSVNEFAPVIAEQPTSLQVSATDAAGRRIAQIPHTYPVSFRSSDPSVAIVDRFGTVTGIIPEREVLIFATTTHYGISVTDSVRVKVGYPQYVTVTVIAVSQDGKNTYSFSPDNIYIAAGGTVTFLNGISVDALNTDSIDVHFSDPSVAHEDPFLPLGSGHIPPFVAQHPHDALGALRTRLFPVTGTYEFWSELRNAGGRIHVR